MLHIALALSLSAQASGGEVLPVYRDLLTVPSIDESVYARQCGYGAGPLELFRPADLPTRRAFVNEIDAAHVVDRATQALARAATALPGARVTVCLFPGELSRGLPYLSGVGGVSLGGGAIKLILHPGPKGLHRVPYTVAHEYHHEVERNRGPAGLGPIDIMIREGKADYFAISLYPELRPPHTQALAPAQLAQALRDLEAYDRRQSPASVFRSEFMIGKDPRVLPWPGYRLGYEMVESYFRGRKTSPADVVTTPAHVIYEQFTRHRRR